MGDKVKKIVGSHRSFYLYFQALQYILKFFYLSHHYKHGASTGISRFTKDRLESADFNGQSKVGKIEIRLEKRALNNFKVYGWQK